MTAKSLRFLMIVNLDDEFKIVAENCIVKNDVLYIFEWTEYRIVGDDKDAKVFFGDVPLDSYYEVDDKVVIPFTVRNYIGFTKIRIVKGSRIVERQVRVLSKKIPKIYGRDTVSFDEIIHLHDEFCEKIVFDITKKCTALPFTISSPTGFEFIESEEPVSLLFAYHFLKSNIERITLAYEIIKKYIHRKLVDHFKLVDAYETTNVDEETLLDILYNPERLIESKHHVLVIDKRGYAPIRVLQRERFETLDTLENRFTKYFLGELINWCNRVLSELGNNIPSTERNKIEELYTTLECFWNDPIFSDVGELTMFPYTSQVLLKREGYRDLLELWKEFRTYSPFFGELERAIANKDIAKLYEYWCFFKLVEELCEIFGECKLRIVVEPTGELSESGIVYAEFEDGWKLFYNLKKQGYSVSLKPDFLLFKYEELIGVFDAKFKLDIINVDEFAEEEEEMGMFPVLQTWAKLEDIYKMHTYRDALKAKFAVIFYPGDRSLFFKVDGERVEDFDLNKLLDKDRAKLEGVGYLRSKPELGVD